MNTPILILLSLFMLSCSVDRIIPEVSKSENNTLSNFQILQNKSVLKIADKNEPGEKLLLCLTFIDKKSKRNLSNQLVTFYHTSTEGNYEQTDPNDESTARLSGEATTNHQGQIYIETILPGDYGSSDDNCHIHTSVYGARPEAYDIFFKQYSSNGIGRLFDSGNDQMFITDLKKTKENTLVGFLTIEVKKPNQKKE